MRETSKAWYSELTQRINCFVSASMCCSPTAAIRTAGAANMKRWHHTRNLLGGCKHCSQRKEGWRHKCTMPLAVKVRKESEGTHAKTFNKLRSASFEGGNFCYHGDTMLRTVGIFRPTKKTRQQRTEAKLSFCRGSAKISSFFLRHWRECTSNNWTKHFCSK